MPSATRLTHWRAVQEGGAADRQGELGADGDFPQAPQSACAGRLANLGEPDVVAGRVTEG
jgi:hypothetical protein